jgi:hypothetical protein
MMMRARARVRKIKSESCNIKQCNSSLLRSSSKVVAKSSIANVMGAGMVSGCLCPRMWWVWPFLFHTGRSCLLVT